ncbi:MAG TPA: biotin--[acetyl-CoA-carboxylase] ligase [Actinomycetota bacterium]|nr:biotin--[acetyl-CoA-carboxylase] ligase [Actinomycetota bacterium]
MLNEEALRRALDVAGLDAPVRWFDVVGSTNREAVELARAGAPAWTLVGAAHQTAGRGRAGRAWLDRPGGGVMVSVVLRPSLDPERIGLVSLAAGAAMAGAAAAVAHRAVRCKWPNDLLADGAKVGGILAEADVDGGMTRHVVVGVGVNLVPPAEVPGAGGLGEVDPEALLSAFLLRLRSLIDGDPGAALDAWRARSHTLGRIVEATTIDGTIVRGVAVDVDDGGGLLVDGGDGPVRVASGDVDHLRPADGER